MPKICIVESPFRGDTVLNVQYARRCLRDSIDRGETPFAGHLLYTQVLNDEVLEERNLGMVVAADLSKVLAAGVKANGGTSMVCAVYDDLGISEGMKAGIEWAAKLGATVEFRKVPSWPESKCVVPKNVTPLSAEAALG